LRDAINVTSDQSEEGAFNDKADVYGFIKTKTIAVAILIYHPY
jgi:hypothetical protein